MDTKNLKVIKSDGSKALIRSTILESEKEAKIKIELLETAVIDEVVVFDEDLGVPLDSEFYGDGYQMLSSYVGEVGDIYKNSYSTFDSKFQLPRKNDIPTAYNYIVISAPDGYHLYGATTCNSYRTEFRMDGSRLVIAQIFENKEYTGGNFINLEGIAILKNSDASKLFDEYADLIERNYPRRVFKENPVGWCTWYTFGPDVSVSQIKNSLRCIKERAPFLKYIQIDDGYQPFMGDWLEVRDDIDTDMKTICLEIKNQGYEAGIWLAPFIASGGSRLLKEHPDWFISDGNGKPLCADEAVKPAWRDAPWYFLDPTNPDALKYIVDVCKIMKNEWKVSYFKLDANVWGALPFGHRYDDRMTSVEAYRHGMRAICDALGDDSYIMVCTAPFWPSLGFANSIRTSADIVRAKVPLLRNVRENLHRAWTNNKLWLVDADVIITDTEPTLEKSLVKLQNISIAAGGGVKMFGEDPEVLNAKNVSFLQRLEKHKNVAAKLKFDLSEGIAETEEYIDYFYFNFCENDDKSFKAPKSALDVYENKMVFPNGTITLKPLSAEWLRIKK